jgi:hypothetical protein
VSYTTEFILRTRTNIVQTTTFYIGTNINLNIFTDMEISGFEVAYCPVDTLEELDVAIG